MLLKNIPANERIIMTTELLAQFKKARCSPTVCHACLGKISVGHFFHLVTHNGNDEMCCNSCSKKSLEDRDKRIADRKANTIHGSVTSGVKYGGYQRKTTDEQVD